MAFKAAVRGSLSQDITLANHSITSWQLKPVIQNDYWSGPEVLAVPAGGQASYPVTYRPLSMSTAEKQHEGSVFFPIPDGTGLLYKLTGVAHSPMPAGTIQCQVKHSHQPPPCSSSMHCCGPLTHQCVASALIRDKVLSQIVALPCTRQTHSRAAIQWYGADRCETCAGVSVAAKGSPTPLYFALRVLADCHACM